MGGEGSGSVSIEDKRESLRGEVESRSIDDWSATLTRRNCCSSACSS